MKQNAISIIGRLALFFLASVSFGATASSISTAQQKDFDPLSYIESGDEVQVGPPRGAVTCSVTIISQQRALTAGHCGESADEVYSKGRRIGSIGENYLWSNQGIDVSEILLDPPVDYVLRADKISDKSIEIPSAIFAKTFLGGRIDGVVNDKNLYCEAFSINGREYQARTLKAQMTSKPGDSGAPVYNPAGELVALIEGGNGKGDTTITPLSFLEEKLSEDSSSNECKGNG